MTQPTKPLSVDEILVSFYNEVESDVLDSRNSGGNGSVITEAHTKAKAQLIELVESVKPEEVKFIENREWYNLGITAYKQALIKAIKGEG